MLYRIFTSDKRFEDTELVDDEPNVGWNLEVSTNNLENAYRYLDMYNYDCERSTKMEVYDTGNTEFPVRLDFSMWKDSPVIGSRVVSWSVRKAKVGDIVVVNVPIMERAWFELHNCIKDGYYFRVTDQWKTQRGTLMYKLQGVQGYEIPWRNKIMAKWCEKASLGEYYVSKYPIHRLMNYVSRRVWKQSFKD